MNNKKSPLLLPPASVILKSECVYSFGFDYKWFEASNSLTFINSFKMKFAVIAGVVQMSIGICMKAANSLYYHKTIEFMFEFLPQLVMMMALFGYMSFLIIVKWLTQWQNTAEAPSVIAFMINIFLKQGEVVGKPFIGDKQSNEQIN